MLFICINCQSVISIKKTINSDDEWRVVKKDDSFSCPVCFDMMIYKKYFNSRELK